MKLEAGKFYKTRDGQKVEILAFRDGWVIGYIFHRLDGVYLVRREEGLDVDIIAEWSDEPDLLPCPFCGSQHTSVVNETTQCVDCSTSGPHAESREEAIAAWNKRAK